MRLRLRLALSYLMVIGLFLVTLAVAHALVTIPAANHFRDEAISYWKGQWQARLDRAYSSGGWEEVVREAESMPLPPGVDLILEVPGQGPRALRPQPPPHLQPGPPLDHRVAVAPPPGASGPRPVFGLVMRFPADQELAVGEGGALKVRMRPLPPHERLPADARSQILRGVVLSGLAGALVAFAAGLWLSSSISGPVQKLAAATRDLGDLELSRRVEVTGSGELAELGKSFNEMAARLQETVRHLSEEKRRVERLEQNQRQFLADVSHNLRTPLAAVLGWTEALQEGMAQGDELEKISREVLYVSQTLQRLVDLSRWESSEPHLQKVAFDLREPLGLVVDTLAPSAEARQVGLRLEGTDRPIRVVGDPVRLRELLQILLENAVYHAGAGTGVCLSFQPAGDRLEVSVQDDGCGFDPSATRGLGLPIARRLARAHGGELGLTASPGQGTRAFFTVSLETPQDC